MSKSKMSTAEAWARVALLIDGHGDGREQGVFREGDIVACKLVYKLIVAMPGVKAEMQRLCDARRNRARVHLFKGFEHELTEDAQVELYGKVVTAYTGPRR